MQTSVNWVNGLLKPGGLHPNEIVELLPHAGFPIESQTRSATNERNPDVLLDVEITSNRGDCLSHIGLAREIAAASHGRHVLTGRPHRTPGIDPTNTASLISLVNQVYTECPRFTLRVIRGVKIGPSPAWLRTLLESVGQRSINNVVDATNWLNLEWGNPCHAFDLAKLAGPAIVVRRARKGERLTTLDGKSRELAGDEVVVADAERAQGLAGVMGGADSEVTDATTDIALEVATWDPVAVRRAARRHGIRTDASHRYERLVDVRTVDDAAERVAALIVEVAGGRLCAEPLAAGPAVPALTRIRLRAARASLILGVEVETKAIVDALAPLGIEAEPIGRGGQEIAFVVPAHRPDLTLEIDLIEEIARVMGLDAIPQRETMEVRVRPPQENERRRSVIVSTLCGMGFHEIVTFTFTSVEDSQAFLPTTPTGFGLVRVDDERRAHEPALRTSLVPSLLGCRRTNQNSGASGGVDVRLFEVGSVFAEAGMGSASSTIMERLNLGLVLDVPVRGKAATTSELQIGVRAMRGAIEALVGGVVGAGANVELMPASPHCGAFRDGAYAGVEIDGVRCGYVGIVTDAIQKRFGLERPVVASEMGMKELLGTPTKTRPISVLPQMPSIDRDVSLIVDERLTWREVLGHVESQSPRWLEHVAFVGTYRGAQVGAGRKSLTLRCRFRDASATLRNEELDPVWHSLLDTLRARTGAEIRS
ncbi:MAG: phenylalanine--tRNA ligase subunit beta [Phycisphaerales bacterium]